MRPKKYLLDQNPKSLWGFYCSLPNRAVRSEFYDKVCDINDWAKTTFYENMHGNKYLPKGQAQRLKRIIEDYSTRYNINIKHIEFSEICQSSK